MLPKMLSAYVQAKEEAEFDTPEYIRTCAEAVPFAERRLPGRGAARIAVAVL